MATHTEPTGASIAPVGVAVGIVVLLVGIVISPFVIAPLGAAVTAVATIVWVRSNGAPAQPPAAASAPAVIASGEDRYPRNRFLERATVAVGGLVAAGIALPAAG